MALCFHPGWPFHPTLSQKLQGFRMLAPPDQDVHNGAQRRESPWLQFERQIATPLGLVEVSILRNRIVAMTVHNSIYICVYLHIRISSLLIFIYTSIYICMKIHTYTSLSSCLYPYLCSLSLLLWICIHVYMYTYIYIHVYVYIHISGIIVKTPGQS